MHRRITLILMISSHASSCGPAPEEERLASEQLAIAQRLQVSEDVQAVFTRAYQWNISKTGPEEITVEIGQTKSVPYAVAVRVADPVDRGWSVRGHIGIDNFTKRAAVIKRVTDSVDGLIDATVACGQDYPIRLAAGTGLECIYSADLPDATFSSNTSCAETRGRIAGACATVPIDFSAPTMETVDDCVNVTDDRHGPLGFACARTGPLATWDYEVVVGPYDRCGTYEVPNTACFETFNSFTSAFNFPRRECQTSILEVDVPCGVCGPHGRNLRRFEVTLAPLNDSFASGTAELILCGDQLTVQFRGHNLEPGRHAPHQLHIQGLDSRRNATCPPPEAAGSDGFLSFEDGQPYFGDRLFALTPFPFSFTPEIAFDRTYTVDRKALRPLPRRTLVVYGMHRVGMPWDFELPVLCGEIRVAADQSETDRE